jgi:hypothetical protein
MTKLGPLVLFTIKTFKCIWKVNLSIITGMSLANSAINDQKHNQHQNQEKCWEEYAILQVARSLLFITIAHMASSVCNDILGG